MALICRRNDSADLQPSSGLKVFNPEVLSFSDYYPFGQLVPNRHGSSTAYRYGFNGMELDNELKGEGNSYDFGARMLDPRIGRWFARDPMEAKYPNMSSYAYAINNPIVFIDVDGRDVGITVTAKVVGTTKINLYSAGEIKKDSSLKGITQVVPVYEVVIKNESGSTATFYFTRDSFRGSTKDKTIKEVTFDVKNDGDTFSGKIKSRWKGVDNVLELRNPNDINDQTISGMKAGVEAERTAIQIHVKGASDGCLLAVGYDQFESIEEGVKIDKTNLGSNSKISQANFMNKVKEFLKEDKLNGKGQDIDVSFNKSGLGVQIKESFENIFKDILTNKFSKSELRNVNKTAIEAGRDLKKNKNKSGD